MFSTIMALNKPRTVRPEYSPSIDASALFQKKNLNCLKVSHGYAEKGDQLLLTSKCFLRAHSQYWYFLQVLNTKVVFGVELSQVSSCLILDKH